MHAKRNGQEPKNMFPDELEAYLKENREGTYTLLDVRQPGEYEEGHLPGARLLPLPELAGQLGQLDREKPVVVYCAVGGRSKMAAQLLSHQGFRDVRHLQGGIEAWEQPTATGPVEFHLQFLGGDEPPEEVITLAYHMEEALKEFHEAVKAQTDDAALSEVLSQLIRAEEKHESRLLELLSSLERGERAIEDLKAAPVGRRMEGGMDVDEYMARNQRHMRSVAGYLELAMMIETQALDLYLRMAADSRVERSRNVLLQIADEEKAHLELLGRLMEEKGKRGFVYSPRGER